MRTDMIEKGDTVLFTIGSRKFRALIQETREDGMKVKVIQRNMEFARDGDFEAFIADIDEDMFELIDLHIWTDGRGVDNSAIGCSGHHAPWKEVWITFSEVA